MSEEEIREYSEYQKAKQVDRLKIMESWLRSVGITWEKESNTILFNRILGLEIFKQHQLVHYLLDVGDEKMCHVDPWERNIQDSKNRSVGSRSEYYYRQASGTGLSSRSDLSRSIDRGSKLVLQGYGDSRCQLR